MPSLVENLQRENAELRGQIATLVVEMGKLNERVAELLAMAQRKQRKKATSLVEKKPEQAPVADANTQRAFDERP